jgi:hypothetical protein
MTSPPSRKSAECALASGNSTSLPKSNPGARVVLVVVDVVAVVLVVVVVVTVVVVLVVVLVVVVVLAGAPVHAPHIVPEPIDVPPAAEHVAASRATRVRIDLHHVAFAAHGTQQTTADG